MSLTNAWKSSKFRTLMEKLKSFSDVIEMSQAPILNKDMHQLIELTETTSKSEALQYAVTFTIDNIKQSKLEMLRYTRKEAHEARMHCPYCGKASGCRCDELLDTIG